MFLSFRARSENQKTKKTLFLCLNFKISLRTIQKNAEHNTRVRNTPTLVDRRANWCSTLSRKYPDTLERLCEPKWSDKLGCCKTCKDFQVVQTTAETVTNPIASRYLMYTVHKSQTIYSYNLDVDRDPVKNGQFTIPYKTRFPGLTFNSHSSELEIIGDWYSHTNKNHQMMTVTGSFSNVSNSLFDGDDYFEVVHSQNVGTLVFSGHGHYRIKVYIITQNPDWNTIDSSDKYLSRFRNPAPGYGYHGYGVVEHENKIYLVGGWARNAQKGIQFINFDNVEKLQDAQTRNWISIGNLKSAVDTPAMIYLGGELLIVGWTDDTTTCQDVQYSAFIRN